MGRKRKCWSYSAGERPYTVRVFEKVPDGVLYVRTWNAETGRWRKRSLGHRDRERAIAHAHEQTAKLRAGTEELQRGDIKLGLVFAAYERHRSSRKSEGERKEDTRRIEMWTRVLGADQDPHRINVGQVERFIDLRTTGAIDSRGHRVSDPKKRRSVRAARAGTDVLWLRWTLDWATRWRDREGRYLMRENPVRGVKVPKEKNPRRPVATRDRYEKLRAKSDEVMMEVQWAGETEEVRSHLSELLDLAVGTGRRLSALCRLRYADLRLERTETAPYGAIVWRAENDKMGRETVAPIGPEVREALDRVIRERPGVGSAPLFPSPKDRSRPIRGDVARKWLVEGERLAKLKSQDGSLWHAFRRLWATERKHLPAADVARAGGWANAVTLQLVYQQPDPETMLRVVLEHAELREAKG